MKRHLTSDDIRAGAAAGILEITVAVDDVVTDVAREVAGTLGVRLVEAAGAPSPRLPPAVPSIIVPPRADLLIKNGRVIVPGHGEISADVAVRDGRILALTARDGRTADVTIDAAGQHVLPGLVDPHIHLGIFGDLEQEMATETRSALVGGVTTAGCMVAAPGSHHETVARWMELVGRHSWIDIVPHLVLGSEQQLDEVMAVGRRHGIRSFKVYMAGIEGLFDAPDDGFLLEAARRIRAISEDAVMLVHCENQAIVQRATARMRAESPRELTLAGWAEARPALAEAEAVRSCGYMAQAAGVKVYFVHVTSAAGLAAARAVKAEYGRAYAETCSPYLSLTWDADLGPVGKMIPPFRDAASREALWAGLQAGVLDTIGTDHVAQSLAVKAPQKGMWGAAPGYQMLALHLPVLLHEGVHGRRVPLTRIVEAVTRRPAEIFGLYPRKGSLLPESDADIVLVDLAAERLVQPHELHSWSDFSLYDGRRLRGWPVLTIKGGVPVIREGRLVGGRPPARLLTRNPYITEEVPA